MKVQVLLSTFNGEKYLVELLNSVFNQKNVDISILVRDDGSTDHTTNILDYYHRLGLLKWYSGENLRPAHSFFHLIEHASDSDYYAFCDQDDFWKEDKLSTAIGYLEEIHDDKPALYHSHAELVDEELRPLEDRKCSAYSDSFHLALIENRVIGCTMVFNRSLLKLAGRYTPQYILMHDSWIHLLCLSVGGSVYFDSTSHILYRQHSNNVIGGKTNLFMKFRNSGVFKRSIRSRIARELLDNYYADITEENKRLLYTVTNYKTNFYYKLCLLFSTEFNATSLLSNILLKLLIVTNNY